MATTWANGVGAAVPAVEPALVALAPDPRANVSSSSLALLPPAVPESARQIDSAPHARSVCAAGLLEYRLLYPLVERGTHRQGDFLPGETTFSCWVPLTEAIALTNDLHHLWSGAGVFHYRSGESSGGGLGDLQRATLSGAGADHAV